MQSGDYHISAEVRRGNSPTGELMAKVQAVINVVAVAPNANPQYTGPASINDLVVGQGRQLQGFDPDGDPITWSVAAADAGKVSISPVGIVTALVPLGDNAATPPVLVPITVELDDGKP